MIIDTGITEALLLGSLSEAQEQAQEVADALDRASKAMQVQE